jgi:Cu/Ag efflux protein CusF
VFPDARHLNEANLLNTKLNIPSIQPDCRQMISTSSTRAAPTPKPPTKIWLLILLPAALVFSCRAHTQPEKSSAPAPTPPAAISQPAGFPSAVLDRPYPGTGVVKLINVKEGWVEIEHEEVKDLMPAMTMEFWVRNRTLLQRVRVGDKVDFVVVEDSKGQFLEKLDRAPVR